MDNKKIAFDMDGVLLPDFHKVPNWTEDDFFEHTVYARPMFSPVGNFDVVTARTENRRPITLEWLKQLATPPQNLFMKPVDNDETPAEYKYRKCIEEGYKIFVESEPSIVLEMREMAFINNVDLIVIHFSGFVSTGFEL